jgi:UDP-N-acetylmuramate--alanine ligase
VGGHAAENTPADGDLVVYSDAIPPENPELRRARSLGIPTVNYFHMLGRLMAHRRGLAVAGTHGKSTTTAMAAEVLVQSGLDPTVAFGAAALGRSSGGRAGHGPWMLVEACEYRANFLHLGPEAAVILGIEPDHFDYYRSWPQLETAFADFARSVPRDGVLLASHACQATRRVTAGLACRVETFGLDPRADWHARRLSARRGCYRFEMVRHGRALGEVALRVPGRHNVGNALAAAALADYAGVAPERIGPILGRFRGLHRRLETVGTWRGVRLVDDYAHHPTEVAASLEALRLVYPNKRIWCVFQPHQASRTRHLLDELARSLHNADVVLVAEIFRAREPAGAGNGVTAADLAERMRRGGDDVPPVHAIDEIVRFLENRLRPGDVLVTMGAGDIRKICHERLDRLREDRAAG